MSLSPFFPRVKLFSHLCLFFYFRGGHTSVGVFPTLVRELKVFPFFFNPGVPRGILTGVAFWKGHEEPLLGGFPLFCNHFSRGKTFFGIFPGGRGGNSWNKIGGGNYFWGWGPQGFAPLAGFPTPLTEFGWFLFWEGFFFGHRKFPLIPLFVALWAKVPLKGPRGYPCALGGISLEPLFSRVLGGVSLGPPLWAFSLLWWKPSFVSPGRPSLLTPSVKVAALLKGLPVARVSPPLCFPGCLLKKVSSRAPRV